MEDLENQVEQLSQSRAAGELDVLAATPLPALHAALKALTTAVKVSTVHSNRVMMLLAVVWHHIIPDV